MLEIASERLVYDRTGATFFRGWAMAAAGRPEEGISEMRQIISDPTVADAAMTALGILHLMCGPGTADTSRRVNKRTFCARTIKSLTTDFVRNLINAG
jgi:hypothetical protein